MTEPAEGPDLATACRLRHAIAVKVGGDPAFRSAHQPIRVAGTVHGKGTPRLVEILASGGPDRDLTDFAEAVVAMPPMPGETGVLPDAAPRDPMDFNGAGELRGDVTALFGQRIREGGVDGTTRFDALSRVIGYRLAVPAEGNSTFGINVMGRNRKTLTGSATPYFTAPAAATTTEVCNSLNGILRIAGSTVGTVTGLNLNLAMAADAPAVLGQAFPPDVLLGTADVTGDFTALVDDTDAISAAFEEELEVELLFMLTAGGAAADAIAFHLPRLKLNGDEENVQGEGSQTMNVPFQALEYLGSALGMTPTTLRCTDTAAV